MTILAKQVSLDRACAHAMPAAAGIALVQLVWSIVAVPLSQIVRLPLLELLQETEQSSAVSVLTLVIEDIMEPIPRALVMPAAHGNGPLAAIVRAAQKLIVVILPQTVRVSMLQGQESAQHLAVNIIIHAI